MPALHGKQKCGERRVLKLIPRQESRVRISSRPSVALDRAPRGLRESPCLQAAGPALEPEGRWQMIRRIGLATTIAAVAGFALAMPGAASAATTLGETFVPTGSCSTDNTYIQTVSGGQPYNAPYSGVITSWSFQPPGTAVPTTIRLKVGRVPPGADLTTDTSITIIGESAPETPSGSGLNTFPTRIPVQAGDDIGIYVNGVGAVHTCNNDSAYTDHYFA